MIYTDCNCIKGSFDKGSLKNTCTGPLIISINTIIIPLQLSCRSLWSEIYLPNFYSYYQIKY